jgi:hypothetical protein
MQELRAERFDVVHFAGHAWVKDGASYMALYDHVVYASELAMLLNRYPPALLFVNSHHTGFVPAFTVGERFTDRAGRTGQCPTLLVPGRR